MLPHSGQHSHVRKVARNLVAALSAAIDLSKLGGWCLTTVGRIRLWQTPKFNPCPEESQRLQPAEQSTVPREFILPTAQESDRTAFETI